MAQTVFQNKVIWVTGASSGIGEALCLALAKSPCKLVLSARRVNELERVKQACVDLGLDEQDVLVLPLDLKQLDNLTALAQQVKDQFGRIDFLFNNAGVSQRSLCIDTDLDVYRTLLDLDVLGQIAMTKAVLPYMIEQGSGHIAITASVAGKVGVKLRTGYCAAKHAVMGFFDALRAEVAGQGINVTTITPGFIKTSIDKNALSADGSAYGKADLDITNGMDVNECIQNIINGINKGKPEIAMGGRQEMLALWLRRFFPRVLFTASARRDVIQ